MVEVADLTDKGEWPAQGELEKWLMNAARDTDASATFLRKVIQMNPSYGAYLATDEDLAGIVQLFAKRFRAKILSHDNAVQKLRDDTLGKLLYEPLCEISWRIIGHVFHIMMDLEDSENLPVPKEALGQIRMLLNTNVTLSKKFNDMRRAYLKELCAHRDRERVISKRAQEALASLQEDPVMFYEPMDFILDEGTKQFICEVIEERIKLDMEPKSEVKAQVEIEPEDGEDPEKAKMYAEMRKLRTEAAKNEAMAEKAAMECEMARKELEKIKALLGQKDSDIEALKQEVQNLQKQRNELTKRLQQDTGKEVPETVVEVSRPEKVTEKEVVIDNSAKFEGKMKGMKDEIDKLLEKIKQLEREKKEQAEQLEHAMSKISALENKEPTKIVKQKVKEEKEEVAKKPKPAKDNSSDELRRQLEEQMSINKQLREANKALEKALEESKEKAKYRGPKGQPVDIDAEIEAAIAKITEEHKKELKKLQKENDRLQELLAKERGKPEPVSEEEPEKPQKVKTKYVTVEGDGEEAQKWKTKFKDLQEQYDDIEHERDELQNQVRLLLDKLKKYGGEAAVAEAIAECKIKKLPARKKRKKKAWERLYEDAQRRILDMKKRQMEVEKQEKRLLISAASRVVDRKSMRQVENLTHLHKASVATQSMFHDALTKFHRQHMGPSSIMEGEEETEGFTSDEDPGELSNFFQRHGGGVVGSPQASDSWNPELIAAEFQRLRSENRMLAAEIGRLRAMVPLSAAGGDPSFFGLQSVPLSRNQVQKAEMGMSLGSSIGSIALGYGASLSGIMTSETHFRRAGSPARSSSPSPVSTPSAAAGRPQLFSSQSHTPSGSLSLKKHGREGPGRGTREAQHGGAPSPHRSPTPPGAHSGGHRTPTPPPPQPVPMPWRQVAAGQPGLGALNPAKTWPPGEMKSAGSPASPGQPVFGLSPLGRAQSHRELDVGGVPQLTAPVPWRREPGGNAGSLGGGEPTSLTIPAGWSPKKPPPKAHSPDRVLGRVASVGTLEPIAKSSPRTRSDPPSDQSASPSRPRHVPPAAPAAPPTPAPLGLAGTVVLDGSHAGESGAANPMAKSAPQLALPRASVSSRDPMQDRVKPKASGLFVTALRSQEHLRSMSGKAQ